MKKNILWSIVALLAATALCLGFSACSDDDDDDEKVSLIGRWEAENSSGNRIILQFDKAGYVQYTEYDEKGLPAIQNILRYTKEGERKGFIEWGGIGDYRYFDIVDNKLYLYAYGYGVSLIDVFIKK